MELEFPIDRLDIEVQCHGSGIAQIYVNDQLLNLTGIDGQKLKKHNVIKIKFSKADPKDEGSYGEIKRFSINGHSFINDIKTIPYTPDKRYHTAKELPNNLYLGYIGNMQFDLIHNNSLLSQAAWTIAHNEFEQVKYPLKGENFREKTFHNVRRDARFMFTGSLAPACEEIIQTINEYRLENLRLPLRMPEDMLSLQDWINASSRIQFSNFEALPYFTYTNGVVDCLNSFIRGIDKIYLPSKVYYFYREILDGKDVIIKDVFSDEIEDNSKVVLELPSPWYKTKDILDIINKAREKNCKVALDLTWLPITNDTVDLDLNLVDEIFFSMNKTWPIQDFRPAFRWARERINDAQTFQWDHCTYPKIAANVFKNLTQAYSLDYVYDKYKPEAVDIMQKFDLSPTSVLWFTRHKDVSHNKDQPIWPHYYLDDFVCLRKLFDYKGKYFW